MLILYGVIEHQLSDVQLYNTQWTNIRWAACERAWCRWHGLGGGMVVCLGGWVVGYLTWYLLYRFLSAWNINEFKTDLTLAYSHPYKFKVQIKCWKTKFENKKFRTQDPNQTFKSRIPPKSVFQDLTPCLLPQTGSQVLTKKLLQWYFRLSLLLFTSSILLTQVRKSPDISKSNAVA